MTKTNDADPTARVAVAVAADDVPMRTMKETTRWKRTTAARRRDPGQGAGLERGAVGRGPSDRLAADGPVAPPSGRGRERGRAPGPSRRPEGRRAPARSARSTAESRAASRRNAGSTAAADARRRHVPVYTTPLTTATTSGEHSVKCRQQ